MAAVAPVSRLEAAWAPSGQPVPAGLQQRLLQEFAVWEAVHAQVRGAANEQERRLRDGSEPHLEQVRRLMGLKAVAVRTAWVLVTELFAWRGIRIASGAPEQIVRERAVLECYLGTGVEI